jgi:hypothetical protein
MIQFSIRHSNKQKDIQFTFRLVKKQFTILPFLIEVVINRKTHNFPFVIYGW